VIKKYKRRRGKVGIAKVGIESDTIKGRRKEKKKF
jgi:hypothetical protein